MEITFQQLYEAVCEQRNKLATSEAALTAAVKILEAENAALRALVPKPKRKPEPPPGETSK